MQEIKRMNKSLANTQELQLLANNLKLDPLKKSSLPNELSKPENPDLFCVKWIPPIDGFNQFIQDYRNIVECPLGGSRVCRHRYTDTTISKVLSVGPSDNRSSLPQRISLSNFKIGTPITSDGAIYRFMGDDEGFGIDGKSINEPHYLLIKRNDSESYIDLVRGNYRESHLFLMIQSLPLDARQRLLTYANEYDTLWVDLHMKPAEGDVYEFGKEAFVKIAPHFKTLFEKVPSIDPEGKFLWLFPKGRPQWREASDLSPRTLVPESPFECALREFYEETNGINLTTSEGTQLLFSEPIIERYLGSNSKNYQTNYFVFKTSNKHEIQQFSTIETPIREVSTDEVSEIKWVPLSRLSQYLRPSRLELINYIETNLPQTVPEEVNSIWKCPAEINDFMIDGSY